MFRIIDVWITKHAHIPLAAEFKAERARVDYRLQESGIDRETFLFSTHVKHLWHDFWHAVYNVFILPPMVETTVPGAMYRTFEYDGSHT